MCKEEKEEGEGKKNERLDLKGTGSRIIFKDLQSMKTPCGVTQDNRLRSKVQSKLVITGFFLTCLRSFGPRIKLSVL